MDGTKDAGLNRVQWNLSPSPTPEQAQALAAIGRGGGGGGGGRGGRGGGRGSPFINPNAVDPGTYIVKLTVGGKELMTTVQVAADNLR
jgi:hypothetical protein